MIQTMNAALEAVDAYPRYQAGSVGWNDGRRGMIVVDGVPTLSSFGNNITDVRIVTDRGGVCQYIKPPNMDETVGVLHAKDVLMGANVSVQDVLDDIEARCAYAGYESVEVNADADEQIVVRFQTCWVPLLAGTAVTKIAPEHFSYQTRSRSDPRNLLLLGTPNGVFVHSDDAGGNKLFAHSVAATGEVTNHWFEARVNAECSVGQSTRSGGVEMGVRGMGPRANCFVTVAIPNAQTDSRLAAYDDDFCLPVYRSVVGDDATLGVSHAAIVTASTDAFGTYAPNATYIRRAYGEPIVVTVLTYNTVEFPSTFKGEDPTALQVSTSDVALGVADLDRQYDLVKRNCGVVCKLSQLPAMLHKLT